MKNLIRNVKTLRQGYEELHQLSCQTAVLMTTDSAEFEAFGIDQTEKVDLEELTESFNQRDFDEKFELIQKLKTDLKNQKAKELLLNIYKFETEFDVQWSKSAASVSAANLGNISQDSDLKLLSKAKAFVNALGNLEIVNTQSAIYLALQQSIADFSKAIEEQQTAILERKIATEMRQGQAIELFNKVRRIREFGKRMWQIKGEKARSEAYLLPKSKAQSEVSETFNSIEVKVNANEMEPNEPITNS